MRVDSSPQMATESHRWGTEKYLRDQPKYLMVISRILSVFTSVVLGGHLW